MSMNGEIYDDLALEKAAKDQFGVDVDIDKVIVRSVDVGRAARATVFLSKRKQLFCYVHGPSRLLFGDVQKIAGRMGLKVELYFPPRGHKDYFDQVGRDKFRDVFPGRKEIQAQDIVFYRTLAPYSPALLLISEVKDGTIYQADSDARYGWRPAIRFTYRRIKTS